MPPLDDLTLYAWLGALGAGAVAVAADTARRWYWQRRNTALLAAFLLDRLARRGLEPDVRLVSQFATGVYDGLTAFAWRDQLYSGAIDRGVIEFAATDHRTGARRTIQLAGKG